MEPPFVFPRTDFPFHEELQNSGLSFRPPLSTQYDIMIAQKNTGKHAKTGSFTAKNRLCAC